VKSDNKIVPFVPPGAITASENVREFVRICREELTAFGTDLDWESETWDLTGHVELRGKNNRIRASWANFDTTKSNVGALMHLPFLDFAKAYFRYLHSLRPTKAFQNRIMALRALEFALCEIAPNPIIENADAAVFNRAAQLTKEKYSQGAAYRVGQQLETLAAFVSEKRLTRSSFSWRNPLKRDADKNRVGKQADDARKKKLPSEEALTALAKAYCLASDPVDVLITSMGALLCAAPSRISELLTLPDDCEYEDSTGEKNRYALRWWPAKGAPPMLKWVVGTMDKVARDAIHRIRKVTEPWRQVAAWYEEHPNQIYLPEEYEHLRDVREIPCRDLIGLLGLKNRGAVDHWLEGNNIGKIGVRSNPCCSFDKVQNAVLADLPAGFPIIDRHTGLRYSQALFVVPHNFFHSEKGTSPVMIAPVTHGAVADGLGGRTQYGIGSVFTRLEIEAPSGAPIKLDTHQFRHLLNTMAQRGGASQFDIARWSGRKDVSQNNDYDHLTGEEFVARVRQDDGGSIVGPFAEFLANAPVAKRDFLASKFSTAHVTEIGFCVHVWVATPCPRHLDCINCTSHVCFKGDRAKTERIRTQLCQSLELLAQAEQAHQGKYTGADRWLEHHRLTVERLQQLIKILDDPDVPDGAVISLSVKGEYSAIGAVIDERLRLEGADTKEPALGSGENVKLPSLK